MISPHELFVKKNDELTQGLRDANRLYDVVKLGAVPRQLLADAKPLLHQANRSFKLDIRFVVNDVGSITDVPVTPAVLVHSKSLDPQALHAKAGTKSLKLSQFLGQPVIETPTLSITVLDVIHFSANKYGGIHFDETRSSDEKEKDAVFEQTRRLGLEPVAELVRVISEITLRALKPLRDSLVDVPPDIKLMAYYKLADPKAWVSFSGRRQSLETNNMKASLAEGFSWNGVISIKEKRRNGTHFIYEIGNLGSGAPRIGLCIDRDGTLHARVMIGASTVGAAGLLGFPQSPYYGRFHLVTFQVAIRKGQIAVQLLINNRILDEASSSASVDLALVNRQTIGSDLLGQRTAEFDLKELAISDQFLSQEQLDKLFTFLKARHPELRP